MSQTRTTAIVIAKWTEESSYTKNHMQLENQIVEEIVFPAEGESAEYGERKNYNQNVLYLKIRTKKEFKGKCILTKSL